MIEEITMPPRVERVRGDRGSISNEGSSSDEEEREDKSKPLPLSERKSFIVQPKTLWPSEVKTHMKITETDQPDERSKLNR